MAFETKQELYAGPFPVLLDLIEKKKLIISELSLARIADDFTKYINTHAVPHDELADFLLIASKLIYLKTKELLPYLIIEEEEAENNLVDQMRIYQYFVEYAKKVEILYTQDTALFFRPFNLALVDRVFAEPNITVDILRTSFERVIKNNEPFFLLRKATMERVESVKERIERLTHMIKMKATFGFKEITNTASKADIVVSFLALLDLLKSRMVRATQQDDHDILIERI